MPKLSPLSAAIRKGLAELGADTEVDLVKVWVLEHHPELKEDVESSSFSTKVSQNRGRRAKDAETNGSAPVNVSPSNPYNRYAMGDEFYAICGGSHQHCEKVLGFLSQVDPDTLRQCYLAWKDLMGVVGGMEKAREVLATMKRSGMLS